MNNEEEAMSNDEFTASNGLTIRHNIDTGQFEAQNDPFGIWSHVKPLTEGSRSMFAMQEYFQAKRDKELGRWRSKLHPGWTAVPDKKNSVTRFRNDDGLSCFSMKEDGPGSRLWPEELREVAKEFLADHPTPKPWHDAKQNELWELTIRGCITAPEVYRFAQDTACVDSKVFRPVNNPKRVWFEASDNAIESARRIWPESKETTND